MGPPRSGLRARRLAVAGTSRGWDHRLVVADVQAGVDMHRESEGSRAQTEGDVFAGRLAGQLGLLEEQERLGEAPLEERLQHAAVNHQERGAGRGHGDDRVLRVLRHPRRRRTLLAIVKHVQGREQDALVDAEAQAAENGAGVGVGALDEPVDGVVGNIMSASTNSSHSASRSKNWRQMSLRELDTLALDHSLRQPTTRLSVAWSYISMLTSDWQK